MIFNADLGFSMLKKNHIWYIKLVTLVCCMLIGCITFSGCESTNDDDGGRENIFETTGSPPEIESIEFRRYVNGEYVQVVPELYATDGYIYHFSQDEYISFIIKASDPDLDMYEVTITTNDPFDEVSGDPLDFLDPPQSIHMNEIDWCESFDISICTQPEEDVTFYIKNAFKLDAGFKGPKNIWIVIDDLGGNSSNFYPLYARSY